MIKSPSCEVGLVWDVLRFMFMSKWLQRNWRLSGNIQRVSMQNLSDRLETKIRGDSTAGPLTQQLKLQHEADLGGQQMPPKWIKLFVQKKWVTYRMQFVHTNSYNIVQQGWRVHTWLSTKNSTMCLPLAKCGASHHEWPEYCTQILTQKSVSTWMTLHTPPSFWHWWHCVGPRHLMQYVCSEVNN